ncbi:hypothetical protein JCM15765_15560 [Paradesulfitobacterium aromaticivorans]
MMVIEAGTAREGLELLKGHVLSSVLLAAQERINWDWSSLLIMGLFSLMKSVYQSLDFAMLQCYFIFWILLITV